MLSLVLYGRNDSHGYNLHKRAAISLNAMAEVLTDADDEILFVDYNTPDDLPTFPEAINDTLTDRAKDKMRILRVRSALHEQFRERTHLNALESVSRNIATRRSNPNNRWVLSTNTDMIFVPHERAESLTDIVRDIPNAFYELPRMELPEVLWEGFDRRDGVGLIERTRAWAERFHLNEIVRGSDEILFDAPGDFQLCLRTDLFEMHGFHEGMLRGWHVDSNLCARMFRKYGRVESLAHRLFGYHCDHTRQASYGHGHDRLENNMDEFIAQVKDPGIPTQSESWGMPDAEIEEVRLGRNDVFSRYITALEAAIPDPQTTIYESAYRSDTYGRFAYPRAHVLPFLVDFITPFPRDVRILYVGARSDTFGDFARAHALISGGAQLIVPDSATWLSAPNVRSLDLADAVEEADLLIFEFGVEDEEVPLTDEHRRRLAHVRRAFVDAAAHEQQRVQTGGARRRVVAINAIHNEFEAFIIHQVAFTLTPFASRVRHGYFLLEGPGPDPGFDVRTVWRDIGKTLGRARPVQLVEGHELVRLATAAVAAPDAPLATEALACAEPLIAMLRHPQVEQAAYIPRASALQLAGRLAAERASERYTNVAQRRDVRGRAALSRVADSTDWDRPEFARFVAHHFGGPNANAFPDRNLWTWERVAVLDALAMAGGFGREKKVLLISTVPDALASALADYFGEVHLARIGPPGDGRMLSPGDATDDAADVGFPRWSPGAPTLYDAVVVIQNALLAHGVDRFPAGLLEASDLLTSGGLLIFSTDASVVGAPGRHELSASRLAGSAPRALANGSGLVLLGPFESRVSAASLDRVFQHRRPDLRYRELVFERPGGRISTKAIVTLRRTGAVGSRAQRLAALREAFEGDWLLALRGRALHRARPHLARAAGFAARSRKLSPILARADQLLSTRAARPAGWAGAPAEWADELTVQKHVRRDGDRFFVDAGASDGHAIYGPYLPLGSGRWRLSFKARLSGGAPDARLHVDVVQADAVLRVATFVGTALNGERLSLEFVTLSGALFALTANAGALKVETRFALYGGPAAEIWDIALEPVAASAVG